MPQFIQHLDRGQRALGRPYASGHRFKRRTYRSDDTGSVEADHHGGTAGQSRDIVESFDRHKANLKVYDEILMQLDPEAARSKELEAENRELRKMLADMNERLSQIPTAEELRSLVKSEPPAKTK
ncbi:MAG: hypothetical protein ACLUQ6_02340 [Alistipes onderdonkii]